MPEVKLTNCGLCGIYPKWLQKRATPHTFIMVYGFLGLVQAMAFIYMIVTLTTLEKRFKIPSQTTGLILSGNEISQILSLILMYYGGAGHRPRWLAAGVGFSALSCFILVIPHLLYGPGKAALALTQEYLDQNLQNLTISTDYLSLCPAKHEEEQCTEEDLGDAGITPRILVFFSQFVLGIGTTLYFGLGQTYLDDNTKKSSTPMLLGITFALRTTGPALGFILAYFCMKTYIVPALHPVIKDTDPRWLGAWWLGWIILGFLLAVFALMIAMFPKHLPKTEKKKKKKGDKNKPEGEVPLALDHPANLENPPIQAPEKVEIHRVEEETVPTLKDFCITVKRVCCNKILLCNNLSAIFALFGILPYMTYIAKYLEVQYSTSAAAGTVITGPISLTGMVLGFIGSGFFISKVRPRPTRLLSWNVVSGLVCVTVQIIYVFNGCPVMPVEGIDMNTLEMNFTSECNVACNCEGVKYSPVCHKPSMTTFFSACHAGCTDSIDSKTFGNCHCIPNDSFDPTIPTSSAPLDSVTLGPCMGDCSTPYLIFVILSMINQALGSTGRIGNVLVNYRCVETRDKSVAQGVTLMFISLFALIPGPILYGAIIDRTCLIWEHSCGEKGNCWHYDRDLFRIALNGTAAFFTFLGVLFDGSVAYLGRNLDLYGADEEDKRKAFIQEDTVITKESRPQVILTPNDKHQ